jgi:hypothetical protein
MKFVMTLDSDGGWLFIDGRESEKAYVARARIDSGRT